MIKQYQYSFKNLKDLTDYESNSRTHTDQQINQVAQSIKAFGFTNPLLIDDNNGIIAGHCRALAAGLLGLDKVPCVTVDGLDQHQKAALVITDNKIAENAGWDFNALKSELNFLDEVGFDLSLTGIDDQELGSLMEWGDFEAGSESDQGQLDELDPIIIECPHCGKDFDRRKVES